MKKLLGLFLMICAMSSFGAGVKYVGNFYGDGGGLSNLPSSGIVISNSRSLGFDFATYYTNVATAFSLYSEAIVLSGNNTNKQASTAVYVNGIQAARNGLLSSTLGVTNDWYDTISFVVPPAGYFAISNLGSGLVTEILGSGSVTYFYTNGSSGGGSGSATNAIGNNNGVGTNTTLYGYTHFTNSPSTDQYRGIAITNGQVIFNAFNDDYDSSLGWTGIRFRNTNNQVSAFIETYAQHGGINRPELALICDEDIAIVPGNNHVKGSGNVHHGSSADDHDTQTMQHDDALTYGWNDGILPTLTYGHSKILRFYTRATNSAVAYPSIVGFGTSTNSPYTGGDYDGALAVGKFGFYAVPPSYNATTEFTNNRGVPTAWMNGTNGWEFVGNENSLFLTNGSLRTAVGNTTYNAIQLGSSAVGIWNNSGTIEFNTASLNRGRFNASGTFQADASITIGNLYGWQSYPNQYLYSQANGTVKMAAATLDVMFWTPNLVTSTNLTVTGTLDFTGVASGNGSGLTNLPDTSMKAVDYFPTATNVVTWNSNNLYAGEVNLVAGSANYYITNTAAKLNCPALATVNSADTTALYARAICTNAGVLLLAVPANATANTKLTFMLFP
jgi:hypothetical protein